MGKKKKKRKQERYCHLICPVTGQVKSGFLTTKLFCGIKLRYFFLSFNGEYSAVYIEEKLYHARLSIVKQHYSH